MGNPFDDPAVAATYEAWYQTTEGHKADQLEKQVLGSLLRGFPESRTLLETGCGTGHFSRWFAQQGLRVVGLDLSATMLAEAREDHTVGWVVGEGTRLPFPDAAFDLAAFITTLEFLDRPAVALREARRVARRGILLGVLNAWSLLGLKRRIEGWFRPSAYREARFYSVPRLRRLLQESLGEEVSWDWCTTLYPAWFPWQMTRLPWGGLIGMRVTF
ncbi:MAG: class I SAM-dependent methyltransferase [Anaerolineae bacterium]